MLACVSQPHFQLLVHVEGGELVEAADRPIVDENLRYRAAAAAIRHLTLFLRVAVNGIYGEFDVLGVEQTLRSQATRTELGAVHFDFRQRSVSLLSHQNSTPEYRAAHSVEPGRWSALKTNLRQRLLSTSKVPASTLSVGKKLSLRTPFLYLGVSEVPVSAKRTGKPVLHAGADSIRKPPPHRVFKKQVGPAHPQTPN